MIYYVHTKGVGVESEINKGVWYEQKLKMKLFKKFEEIWYWGSTTFLRIFCISIM